MCSLGTESFSLGPDANEGAVARLMEKLHGLLTKVKDNLSDLKSLGGKKMSPLQFTSVDELMVCLGRLMLRDYPTTDESVQDLLRGLPKRVRVEAWRKIYRDYEYQPPYHKYRDVIDEMLEQISHSSSKRGAFRTGMSALAGKRNLGPDLFLSTIRNIVGQEIQDKVYPLLVQVFDQHSGDEESKVAGELQAVGIKASLHSSALLGKGEVSVVLPVAVEWVTDLSAMEGAGVAVTGLMTVGGVNAVAVGNTMPISGLWAWVERMRPKLVGPWEPILKKRIAEMRLRSMRSGREDDY